MDMPVDQLKELIGTPDMILTALPPQLAPSGPQELIVPEDLGLDKLILEEPETSAVESIAEAAEV